MTRAALVTFNRGRVSRYALARATDVNRVALSAEVQTNWLPSSLGPMSLRPGMQFIANFAGLRGLPFVYDVDDTAVLELGIGTMRVWLNGTTLVTRPQVTAVVANDNFQANLNNWTNADEAGASSLWNAGTMALRGTGQNAAIRRQSVAINEQGVKHYLGVFIARGPVTVRIGTSAGGAQLFDAPDLGSGSHYLAFTPTTGTVHIEISTRSRFPTVVSGVQFAAAGPLSIPTPWDSADIIKRLTFQQVNDVIFVAVEGRQPRRIERRANGSWSIVRYEPADGPFDVENIGGITLQPDGINGQVTLTASHRTFTDDHVEALFRLTSSSQVVAQVLAGDNQWSDPIRVVGVDEGRRFTVGRSGTWAGTLTLQRSIGDDLTWTDVGPDLTWTGNGTTSHFDNLQNVIAYYRIGFDGSGHGSGTASVVLRYPGGGRTGVVRIESVQSGTSARGVVLQSLGSAEPTDIWAEGAWSVKRGYPAAVAEYEGRMWFAGRGKVWASVSDAFDRFDPDYIGDAGPLNRYLGSVGRIGWLLPLQRLVVGSSGAEYRIGSTSFDEVVTPTNFNAKPVSTAGSASVPAVRADTRGYFVQRSGRRLLELTYQLEAQDYTPRDLTEMVPEIGKPEIVRIAVQRHPETRVHCVRSDGTVALLVRNPLEDVAAWVDIVTDGLVEDVSVLPGAVEDRVFYLVNRGGVRRHEMWALTEECVGGVVSKCLDSHVTHVSDTPANTVPGLAHLAGRVVAVWADGADLGTYTVPSNGTLQLPYAVKSTVVGLPYEARYKSTRLVNETREGSTFGKKQRVTGMSLMLADTHWQGLQYGSDFDTLDDLPFDSELEHVMLTGSDGAPLLSPDLLYVLGEKGTMVWAQLAADENSFPGGWTPDARLCLVAKAPRPCTVLAAAVTVET